MFFKLVCFYVNKLLFIYWAPTTAPMRRKINFSKAKTNFKSVFPGTQRDFEIDDYYDLAFDKLRKELLKNS